MSEETPDTVESGTKDAGGPSGVGVGKRRNPLGVRWIALGALVLVAGVKLGSGLVVKHVVEQDTAISTAYHKMLAKQSRGDTPTDDEKAAFRLVAFGNRGLVAGLAAMLILLPLAVGVFVGRVTASVRDALLAVALGMAIGVALEGVGALVVAVAAVVYAGLGALAGLFGRKLASRSGAAS